MSGNSFLLDTNILLYLLSGNQTIKNVIDGTTIYVSFVTELELLGFRDITTKEQAIIKKLLSDCIIVDMNAEIKSNVISIRQKNNIKLPDSIIAGTAQFLELPLLTADKGFAKIKQLDILLYEE